MSVGRGRRPALTCSKVRGLLGRTEPSLMHGGRTMKQYTEAFVGIDTAKNKHALAIADPGRDGEIRYLGEIDSAPAAVERMIRKLAGRYEKLYFGYEAGPTGYGLYRQVRALGHDCIVVAPSLVPKRPGDRVKTNRRDAVTLARLLRDGGLTPVWVPDVVHEAVRDLVRARAAASEDLRRKRQQLLSFLLRHGRIYSGRKHWTKMHGPDGKAHTPSGPLHSRNKASRSGRPAFGAFVQPPPARYRSRPDIEFHHRGPDRLSPMRACSSLCQSRQTLRYTASWSALRA